MLGLSRKRFLTLSKNYVILNRCKWNNIGNIKKVEALKQFKVYGSQQKDKTR